MIITEKNSRGSSSSTFKCNQVLAPLLAAPAHGPQRGGVRDGVPQRLPNKKFFFSSTYGALYYQDAGGALVRYSDEVSFQSIGRLDYRKYLYRLPY